MYSHRIYKSLILFPRFIFQYHLYQCCRVFNQSNHVFTARWREHKYIKYPSAVWKNSLKFKLITIQSIHSCSNFRENFLWKKRVEYCINCWDSGNQRTTRASELVLHITSAEQSIIKSKLKHFKIPKTPLHYSAT